MGGYYCDYTNPTFGTDPFSGENNVWWINLRANGDIGIRDSIAGFTSQCFTVNNDPYNYYYLTCFSHNPDSDSDGNAWSYLTASCWDES